MNKKERVKQFMNVLDSITENDLYRNKIHSVKLITEKTIAPRLIVSYSPADDDRIIDGLDKIEEFFKTLK